MSFHIYFLEPKPIINWLDTGAPMPTGFELQYFGEGSRPIRKPNYALCNKSRLGEYRLRREFSGTLFGTSFCVDFSHFVNHPAELCFSDDGDQDKAILKHAEVILEFFANRGAIYGFAGCTEERFARNLYRYDLSGHGRMSTFMVGTDLRRFVPGLYWLNYFSSAYLEMHSFDVEETSRIVGGSWRTLPGGIILRLYNEPSEWQVQDREVQRCMNANPHIFSISRVRRLPPGLNPREYLQQSIELGRQWS